MDRQFEFAGARPDTVTLWTPWGGQTAARIEDDQRTEHRPADAVARIGVIGALDNSRRLGSN